MGIHACIAEILERCAVKVICTGLCDYVDDAAGYPPVFCAVGVRHDFEFLYLIDDGWDRIHTVKGANIAQAIRQEVIASAALPVDGGNRRCLIVGLWCCILASCWTALPKVHRRHTR